MRGGVRRKATEISTRFYALSESMLYIRDGIIMRGVGTHTEGDTHADDRRVRGHWWRRARVDGEVLHLRCAEDDEAVWVRDRRDVLRGRPAGRRQRRAPVQAGWVGGRGSEGRQRGSRHGAPQGQYALWMFRVPSIRGVHLVWAVHVGGAHSPSVLGAHGIHCTSRVRGMQGVAFAAAHTIRELDGVRRRVDARKHAAVAHVVCGRQVDDLAENGSGVAPVSSIKCTHPM
jgi:hypothetical protein